MANKKGNTILWLGFNIAFLVTTVVVLVSLFTYYMLQEQHMHYRIMNSIHNYGSLFASVFIILAILSLLLCLLAIFRSKRGANKLTLGQTIKIYFSIILDFLVIVFLLYHLTFSGLF